MAAEKILSPVVLKVTPDRVDVVGVVLDVIVLTRKLGPWSR
jgi:hypothetical protein